MAGLHIDAPTKRRGIPFAWASHARPSMPRFSDSHTGKTGSPPAINPPHRPDGIAPPPGSSDVIARFEESIRSARETMRALATSTNTLHYEEAFIRARDVALSIKSSDKALAHYSFMINEAANNGGDFLVAAAIMVHNIDRSEANNILRNAKDVVREVCREVLETRKRFLKLDKIPYAPPERARLRFYTQNFMDALICVSQGDGRALMLRMIHRLSSLKVKKSSKPHIIRTKTHTIKDDPIQSSSHVFETLAERFGLYRLSAKFANAAYELEDPAGYEKTEGEILFAINFDMRAQAEKYLEQKAERVKASFAGKGIDAKIQIRVKEPGSARNKIALRGEEYHDVFEMQDLMGMMVFSRQKVKNLPEALAIARDSLGNEMEDFDFSDQQTEEKRVQVDGKTIKYYYLAVKMRDGRRIELQVYNEEDRKILIHGQRAHWAYKLELKTGQKTDRKELAEYGNLMTGDFMADMAEVYKYLNSKWTYVFLPHKRRNDALNICRLPEGSIPADAAAYQLGEDFIYYNGVARRPIWDDQQVPKKPSEQALLNTGDLITVKSGASMGSKPHFAALAHHARTLPAKLYLFLLSNLPALPEETSEEFKRCVALGEAELEKALGARINRRTFPEAVWALGLSANWLLYSLGLHQPFIITTDEIKPLIA